MIYQEVESCLFYWNDMDDGHQYARASEEDQGRSLCDAVPDGSVHSHVKKAQEPFIPLGVLPHLAR